MDWQNRRFNALGSGGTDSNFYQPPDSGWSGDVTDWQGMSQAFDRTLQQEDFQKMVTDDGTTSDNTLIVLQNDLLAALERAYRARHHSSVRTRMHAAARHRGHGHSGGVLKKGLQGYLEWIEKQGKAKRSE
jgi:hypothetical protein